MKTTIIQTAALREIAKTRQQLRALLNSGKPLKSFFSNAQWIEAIQHSPVEANDEEVAHAALLLALVESYHDTMEASEDARTIG